MLLLPLQRYAKWSQRLNVEIYVAYGEANGHATEALSNIRTVKAMSTELQGRLARTCSTRSSGMKLSLLLWSISFAKSAAMLCLA